MSDESFYSPGEVPVNDKENDNDGLLARNLMTDFQDEVKPTSNENTGNREPIKVYLRIRPFSPDELKESEDQGCLSILDEKTVLLSAPQDSFTFKSSIRGIAEQNHKFSFTKVYDETTTQKNFFDNAMLGHVKDFLDGINCLIFTYGVTNSGKTFTIQGNPKNGGILPRSLDVLFNSIKGRQYEHMNLKPTLYQDVSRLSQDQLHYEEVLKKAVLNAGQKDNIDYSILWKMDTTSQSDLSVISTTSTASSSYITANDEDYSSISDEIKERVCDGTIIDLKTQGPVKFCIWVSFAEIYNEYVYDLLDPTPLGKGKKRPVLKLGDDKKGNPYIKGLREIQVNSADEAFKVLRVGQKNQNIAATKLNQNSSRSHSIFTIKILRVVDVDEPHVARISRLSFVDLAGSERYCKTQSTGDRLKEASNINTSIMTLGKCIEYLRYNQQHKNHPLIIPFRENKLTRLFQGFFLGKGKASMVVNINQCASVFDETYNVLKFSSVAKQVTTKSVRNTELFKPKLPKPSLSALTPMNKPGKQNLISMGLTTPRPIQKDIVFDSFPNDDERFQTLLKSYEELRKQLVDERRKNAVMELKIREEVCSEMSEQIVEIEKNYNERLQEEQETMEEMCERRIEMLTKSMKKARKKRKIDRIETDDDTYIPSVLLHAEKAKIKERDETIRTLRAKLAEKEIAHEFYKQTHTPEQHPKVIKRLQNELEEAKETMKVNESHIEELQTTLSFAQDVLEEKELEVEKLKEVVELTESQNEMIELQKLLQTMTQALDEARQKLDVRDEKLNQKDQVIAQLKEQLSLAQENTTDKAQMEEFGRELSKLEEQGKLLHERNEFQSNEIKQLRIENNDIEMQKKLVTDKVEELKRQLIESEDRREQLQFKDEEQNKKIKRFVDIVNNQETALAESEAIIEQLNEKINQITKEKDDVDNKDSGHLSDGEGIVLDEDDEIVFNFHEKKKEEAVMKQNERQADDLQKKLVELEKEVGDFRMKIMSLENELLARRKEEEERQIEMSELNGQILSLSGALEGKDFEIKMIRNQHEVEYRNLKDEFKSSGQELDKKIETYEAEITDLRIKITDLRNQIVAKDKEMEQLRIKFEEKQKDQKEARESKGNQAEKKETGAGKGVNVPKSRVSALKGVKPKVKAESLLRASASSPRSPYKSNFKALKEMEKALKETSEALDKKNNQILTKNKKISEFEIKVKDLEDEVEILNEEKLALQGQVEESTNANKDLECKIESLNSALDEFKDEISKVRENEERSKEQALRFEKEIDVLRGEKMDIELTAENSRKKIEDLQMKNNSAILNVEEYKRELAEVKSKNQSFLGDISALRTKLDELEAVKKGLEMQTEELEALRSKIGDFDRLQSNVDNLKSVNEKLENDLKNLRYMTEEMRSEHEKESSAMKSEIMGLRKEQSSLLDEVASKNSDLRIKITELNKAIEDTVELQSDLCKANETISTLELQVQLRNTERELNSMNTKHQVVNALAKASKKEEERLKEVEEILKEKDVIIEIQKKQLEEKQAEIEELHGKLEELRSVGRDLVKKQQTIQELRWTVIKRDEKLKEMQDCEVKTTELENKLKDFNDIKFQLETSRMQMETQKRTIKERDQQLCSAKKQIEELRLTIQTKEEEKKFQTPKITPGPERSRKRSSDIPLSELKDVISSDKKKGSAKPAQPASFRRSTRSRVSSLRKGSSEENEPVSEELGCSSKKNKGSGRKVLFDLNEQPPEVLQADTPENAKPEKRKRRKLLAKTVGICAESPQVIPPSPTKEDEVTTIVKRQLRSTSRR